MLKKYIVWGLIFVMMILFAGGCSPQEPAMQNEPIVLCADSELQDSNIAGNVPLFSTEPVPCGDCYVSIAGITFTKSSGDVLQDTMQIGTGLDSNFVDSTERGFDIGFMHSANKEVAKRDAYLCLYLRYSFSEEVSQRDSVILDVDLSVKDHMDEPFILIHNSMKDTYVNLDYPYGILIWKGYFDSEYLLIEMNDVLYRLDLET